MALALVQAQVLANPLVAFGFYFLEGNGHRTSKEEAGCGFEDRGIHTSQRVSLLPYIFHHF